MAQTQIKVIKKADQPAAAQLRRSSETVQPAKARVSDWITEYRLNAEAQRVRDLKAFFGSASA